MFATTFGGSPNIFIFSTGTRLRMDSLSISTASVKSAWLISSSVNSNLALRHFTASAGMAFADVTLLVKPEVAENSKSKQKRRETHTNRIMTTHRTLCAGGAAFGWVP